MNSRLDALQAAILRVKLRHLDGWTRKRRMNAEQYQQFFQEYGLERRLGLPVVPSDRDHVFNQYVIRTEHRDRLRKHLASRGNTFGDLLSFPALICSGRSPIYKNRLEPSPSRNSPVNRCLPCRFFLN